MPFKSIGHGKYKSPSGRTFTKKQVVMYHATEGFKPSLIKSRHDGRLKVTKQIKSLVENR